MYLQRKFHLRSKSEFLSQARR